MDSCGATTKQVIFTENLIKSTNSSMPTMDAEALPTPRTSTSRLSYSFVRRGKGSPSTSPVTPQVLQLMQRPGESLLSLVGRLSSIAS